LKDKATKNKRKMVGANHLSGIPKEKSFKGKSKKSHVTGKGPWRLRWIFFSFSGVFPTRC
jgi:hypothetical protein